MVGRFIGTVTLRMYKPSKVLTLHALAATGLVILTMATNGNIAMWAVIAVGLFNSIMFPTIFTLAIDGLGKHTSQASGILCMAIVGGAIVPVVQGALADAIGHPLRLRHRGALLHLHRLVRRQGDRAVEAAGGHRLATTSRVRRSALR